MNSNQTFVKLLIIGDSSVGKSCILMRFTQDRFTEAFYNTIGVDFKTKHMVINNKKCKLQIWDTAGQERFRTITANYYKGANGIMLVFDVTNEESFKNLEFWISEIEKNGASNVQRILVGNKIDLTSKRVVSQQKAEEFAKKHKLNYVQVSASNARNVELIFETIVKNILLIKQAQMGALKGSNSVQEPKSNGNININQQKDNRSSHNSKGRSNANSNCC